MASLNWDGNLGDRRLKLDEDTSGRADFAEAKDNERDLHERRMAEPDELLLLTGGVVGRSEGDDADGTEGMEEVAVLGRPLEGVDIEDGILLCRLLLLPLVWLVREVMGSETFSEVDGDP